MVPASHKVLSLLEAQRQALLTGDLRTLDRLAPTLETALSKVATTGLDPQIAEGVRHAARLNARLLSAARDGIKQARRLIQGSPTDQSLSVYTANGERAATATGKPRDLRCL